MAERRKIERRDMERRVVRSRLAVTKDDLLQTARTFEWKERMPNWTVLIEGREFPTRPLVLKAARASEKNPIGALEAAVILSDLGFEVRFRGATIPREDLPA